MTFFLQSQRRCPGQPPSHESESDIWAAAAQAAAAIPTLRLRRTVMGLRARAGPRLMHLAQPSLTTLIMLPKRKFTLPPCTLNQH